MITEESIERVKQNIDIVEVLGSYLELSKSGGQFKALCPFHGEKTPSFVINPHKNFYHCFGCGASGDTIDFVMEHDKLTYPEAIEKLALLYNIPLSYTNEKLNTPRSTLLEQLREFYRNRLQTTPSALAYLKDRGVKKEMIERFELGYAPNSSETIRFLQESFLPPKEAIELGALGDDNGRIYARFSDRLMFPIYSPSKKLVGFGGRTMINHPAKYLNSPQTKLFSKSHLLYGYHLARESIAKEGKIIVCEGYLDVILLHQAGFSNATATLGTALTKEHLPLLAKNEPEVILAYDGDKAGIAAALKASHLLSEHSKEGGVVIFGGGLDPADMVSSGRIAELRGLFARPIPFIEFVLTKKIENYDLSSPLQKESALKACSDFLRGFSPIIQDSYKPLIASLLNIPISFIRSAKVTKESARMRTIPNTINGSEIAEASLIKTLLDSPQMLDYVLEYIDSDVFIRHKEEFNALKSGDCSHPLLLKISMQEQILPLSPQQVEEQLRLMLRFFYQRRLKEVASDRRLEFKIRAFILGKIRLALETLDKGGLIPYESFSTF
ncbi:MAG: DNA primase [Wolinella sp.]